MISCEVRERDTAGFAPFQPVRRERLAQGFPDCLGPMPQATLTSFVDLGLSDHEIARYFGLDWARVAMLTQPIRGRPAC